MANDEPRGKVLPFRPPRRLPADLERLRTMLDDDEAVFDEADLDDGDACADAAIARGLPGAHEVKADLALLRARRSLASGDVEGALARLAILLESYPAHASAWALRADLYARRGDDEAARRDLDRVVELAPTNPAGYLRRAEFYRTREDRPRALANFRRAALLDPSSTEALHGLAIALSADGDAKGAARAWARAADEPLADAEAYANRGFLHFVAGQIDLALRDYEASLALSPNQPDALGWRGLCRLQLNRCEEAVADFTRLIRMNPSNALAFRRRGEARVRLGQPAEAVADLDRAIALDGDVKGAAHVARGMAQAALGDRAAAVASYDVAVDRDPTNTHYRMRRFELHRDAEDWSKCQVDADALLGLMPDDPAVLLVHARLSARNDRRDDARRDYDRLLTLDPTNADAYQERAQLHVGEGDYEAARADVARAFELRPDDPEIRASYGVDQYMVAQTDDERAAAVRIIASSAELAPDDAEAWARAAGCFRRISRHDEAVAHYDRALELCPDDPDYRSGRAVALSSRGPAPWVDPESHASSLRAALADVEHAMAVAEEEDLELYRQRATLREALGDLEGAVADQTRIIELDPDDIDAYADRATLRKHLGDLPGACADATRVAAMEEATIAELAAMNFDTKTIQRFDLDAV